MPRNGSGTMSIPTTFVANTPALAADVNTNFTDVATAITGSLALDGQSVMTGQLKAADGSITAPGMAFGSDLNTGFYRSASGVIRATLDGTNTWTVSATGVTVTGDLAVSGTITQGGSALVTAARTLTAGTGLTGGGTLAADRTIALAKTAVSAGSYTRATITVDAQGRLTSAAAGASELPTQSGNAGRQLVTDGSNASWSTDSVIRARASVTNGTSSTCTVGTGSVNIASVTQSGGVYTVTFTNALASVNYQVIATVTIQGASTDQLINNISKSTGSFTLSTYRGSTGVGQAVGGFDLIILGGW